jgi:hypothetical protein
VEGGGDERQPVPDGQTLGGEQSEEQRLGYESEEQDRQGQAAERGGEEVETDECEAGQAGEEGGDDEEEDEFAGRLPEAADDEVFGGEGEAALGAAGCRG